MRWADLVIKPRERALIVGGTGAGKSTLEGRMIGAVRQREPQSQHLILDSKPRFRAEWTLPGIVARYPGMDHGEKIAGSVIVHEPEDLNVAWRRDYQIAIAQIDPVESTPLRLSWIAQEFFNSARAKIPRYLWVDEGLDFYTAGGQGIRGSAPAILRVARAGREKGMGLIFCSQRTRGVPPQVISEITKLYLFRLDHRDDVKHLSHMGAPPRIESPEKDHEFLFWEKGSQLEPQLMKISLK